MGDISCFRQLNGVTVALVARLRRLEKKQILDKEGDQKVIPGKEKELSEGYHQVHIAKDDEEKTAFYTDQAYVEDMVIKSSDKKILLADIAETFDNLRKINMMLNPKKCSFGIENGKLLCYMVTSEGIRDNLEKTKALTDMQSPRTLREMWSLSGKLAALNRFLAWSIEKTRKEKIDYKKAN
ncbi:hypothetical protein Tco_0793929 [Tanacetum coccineum]